MATLRSVVNTAAQPGTGLTPVAGGDAGGKLTGYYDEYTVKAGDAQNDVVWLGPDLPLKKGDRFINFNLDWDAMGAGVTLALGDDGSAARYMAATAANAAGQSVARANGILGYKLTQDRNIQVTIAGGAPTVGAKFRLHWNVLRA